MTDKAIPQVDHLLLLVGGNPLPNAVAGLLLGKPEGQLSLIHSEATAAVAQRLQSWFHQKHGFRLPQRYQVHEADAGTISQEIRRALQAGQGGKVGLNYTGGTKAMTVHAYRAAEIWAKEHHAPRPIFSYLDAGSLKMFTDAAAPEKGETSRADHVGRCVEIKIDDLVTLHGWSLQKALTTTPVLPATAQALAHLQIVEADRQTWRTWVSQELESKCRRENGNWKNKTELNKQHLSWPEAASVTATLQKELNLTGNTLSIQQATIACGYKEPKDFCGWLHGKWLEHYVLYALQNLPEDIRLHQCVQNIETREVQFDVDVAAMRGYQLFAISCSTDDTKGLLKSKLFEAYIRARQIGGDEARVSLISCSDNQISAALEREMKRDLDPDGRICVFGREHLPRLGEELTWWIQSQSQEP